jgi:DNA anti-recombination protein RmuC
LLIGGVLAETAGPVLPEVSYIAYVVQAGAVGLCILIVLLHERESKRNAAAQVKRDELAAVERQRLADALDKKDELAAVERQRLADALDKKDELAAVERQRLADALDKKNETFAQQHQEDSKRLERIHLETLESIRKCQK